MKRKILSIVMVLVLLAGYVPTEHVHASNEEKRCPDCDVYWGDGDVDYCQYCTRCEDCCDICYGCGEICTDCHATDFLAGEDEYAPCPDCGYCKGDGRKVTGGTAKIDYVQTVLPSGKTSIGTKTVNLTAVAEGQTYSFTVPRTTTSNRGSVDYGSNPIEVEFTYAVCDHAGTEQRNAVEATCTKDGYTGDTVCVYCGHVVQKGSYIAPTGHGEPVMATENVYARNGAGNIIYNKRGGYNVPVYIVHAPEDVYCDDMTARGCYSGDKICPDCGEVIEPGSYTAKLYTFVLLNDIDEPAYSSHIAAGLKPAEAAQPGIPGYTGDCVCSVCGTVKYGKSVSSLDELPPDGPVLSFKGMAFGDKNISLYVLLDNNGSRQIDGNVCMSVYYKGRMIALLLSDTVLPGKGHNEIKQTVSWDMAVGDLRNLSVRSIFFEDATAIPLSEAMTVQ